MHYYQFNIGDFLTHTAHLSDTEELAYRRMLDWCYLHEKCLPNEMDEIERLIRMRGQAESIQVVLQDFFISTEGGWTQNRIVREIEAYRAKRTQSKKAADARWGKTDQADTALFDLFWEAGMRKVNRAKALKSWTKIMDSQDLPIMFNEDLIEDIKIRLKNKQLGFAEMHPTTYLNNERWTDEKYSSDNRNNQKESSAVSRVIEKVIAKREN